MTCLEAPDTALGIDLATYRAARDHLRRYDIVQTHPTHSGAFAKIIAYRADAVISREGEGEE